MYLAEVILKRLFLWYLPHIEWQQAMKILNSAEHANQTEQTIMMRINICENPGMTPYIKLWL